MKHLDLFAGIGGFSLAIDRVWPDADHVFVENNEFCQKVLKKHWPNSNIYGDIKTFNPKKEALGTVDIVSGGFPCQPVSQAGKRKGTNDARWLWPQMLRVIRKYRPRWVLAENVRGLFTINDGLVFEQICLDLEALGYSVQSFIIPACGVGAPHKRDRVWIVANATGERSGGNAGNKCGISKRIMESTEPEGSSIRGKGRTASAPFSDPDSGSPRLQGCARKGSGEQKRESVGHGPESLSWDENWVDVATRFCVMDYGVSSRLARPRGWRKNAIQAAGNSIVPQVAEQIFKAIKQYENTIDCT